MLPNIYAMLHTPGVAAIVDDRIGAYGTIGPDESRPYLSWIATLQTEVCLSDGKSPADRWALTVVCQAGTEAVVSNLAAQVRLALESMGYITGAYNEPRDPDTGLYGLTLTADYLSI